MKNAKLVLISLFVMLLTACNTIKNDTSNITDLNTTSETTITSSTINNDITQEVTTSNTEVQNSIISDTILDSTSQVTTLDTSSSDSTVPTDITTTTTESTQVSDTSYKYDTLVIPMISYSEYIQEDICKEIAEYFNSMKNVDVQTFQDKQLSAYNSFMSEYLEENSSSMEDMLSTYNSNILKSHDPNCEVTPYTSSEFTSIELTYPNDFDSIMNTMNYINQLDDITTKYEDYTISNELSAYYELQYTIHYTLHGDDVDDYISSYNGKVLVLQMGDKISLIMLS